jgi:CheY-like chemotaxis protein
MKGSKILLVDDEVVFTTNMSKLLTNRGYKVTQTAEMRPFRPLRKKTSTWWFWI